MDGDRRHGRQGKIYRLERQPGAGDAARTRLRVAGHLALPRFKGRIFYATANPGKISRLTPERAPRGTYESEVRDAQMISTWGSITWRGNASGTGKIEVSTRSGNVETPDDTWSAWSTPYTTPGSPIVSPKARYIQWRAAITGSGEAPVLTSITAAYLQRNLRPQVRSVTVHPPGIVFQKPYSTGDPELAGFENQTTPERKLTQAAQNQSAGSSAVGRKTYQKGLETLQWRADDDNDDDLAYEVEYRREGETTWKVLRKDVTENNLAPEVGRTAQAISYAKGCYLGQEPIVRLRDLGHVNRVLTGLPSIYTAGSLEVVGPNGICESVVTLDVKDDQSAIQRVEYSVDGESGMRCSRSTASPTRVGTL
jgi:folate-binding protein YgfZ